MNTVGSIIRLRGKTAKGKNRITKYGELWFVLAETNTLLFSGNINGPWIFVTPSGRMMNDPAARWIHELSDVDFEIIG